MIPVRSSVSSLVWVPVLAAAVLASGCGKKTAPGTKVGFGASNSILDKMPDPPQSDEATNKAAYDQSVAQAALDKAAAAIEKQYGKENTAIIVIDGVPGPPSDADRYLERKIFKAAYLEYEAANARAQQQTEANKKAAEQKALDDERKTWGEHWHGPSFVWYRYRPVESDARYPHVQGGPYGAGRHVYYVGPVKDLGTFASHIHVGTIVETDAAARTLKIQSVIPSPIPDIDVEELGVQLGKENLVTIEFPGVDGNFDRAAYYFESQLKSSEANKHLMVVSPRAQLSTKSVMVVGPVSDLNEFALNIKFGTVTQTDAVNRKLVVSVNLPKDLPPRPSAAELAEKWRKEFDERHQAAMDRIKAGRPDVAKDGHPDTAAASREDDSKPRPDESQIDWALRILRKGDDPHTAREALTALTVQDVDADRLSEVADVLVQFGTASNWAWHVSEKLIPAMGAWSTDKTVRFLATKLTDIHYSSQSQAILQALSKNPSEEAARAAAALMTDRQKGVQASTALRDMGPVAEKTVLKLAQDRFPSMRIEAYDILRVIGTQEGLAKLKSLLSSERDKEGKEALKSAIADLKKRLDEQNAEASADDKSAADKTE